MYIKSTSLVEVDLLVVEAINMKNSHLFYNS